MKNFRKVLALVLVVATLFSFTAMASAANYEDAKDIRYTEAVDVLSAIGILNGYEVSKDTYEFHPTATISREEMAKMIAVLANAGYDVSDLYATACDFADVAKDRWSASYVAYCAKTGIVAGRSAKTFDPTGKVTGLETAKMLLVTLGFNAEHQGYVGADWKVNVLRDAKIMGLTENFAANFDIDAPIKRDEAAQMMLNALEAPVVVGFLSDDDVTVTNALVFKDVKVDASTLAQAVKVVNFATLKDALKTGKWALYGNVIISDTILFKALYGGSLKKTGIDSYDCQGRPGVKWIWTTDKGEEKVLSSYALAPIFTSHNTDADEVADKIGAYKGAQAVSAADTFFFVDGEYVGKTVADDIYGRGVEVEVYIQPYTAGAVVKNSAIVVIVNNYLGWVENVDTNKDRVKISYMAADKTYNTVIAPNTFGFKHADEGTALLLELCNEHKTHTWNEATGKYTVALHTAEVVKPIEMKLHGFWDDEDLNLIKFCDGNKKYYEPAKIYDIELNETMLGKDYDLYLDEFGYAKFMEEITEESLVTVIVDDTTKKFNPTATQDIGEYEWDYTAQFVEFEANPTVGKAIAIDAAMYDAESSVEFDNLVKYTVDAEGKRCYDVDQPATVVPNPLALNFILKKADGQIENLQAVYGDNETQYLLRVYNYITGKYEYKLFDGKEAIDNDYILTNLQYFAESPNTHNGSSYMTYVYAHADYAAASKRAFITSFDSHETYITKGGEKLKCDLYNAIVDGKEALVAFEQHMFAEGFNPVEKVWEASYQMIVAESHDGLPIYMVAGSDVKESMGKNFVAHNGVLEFVDGVISYEDLAPNAKITVLVKKDGKITIAADTADELIDYVEAHNNEQVYGWFTKDSNDEVDLLYVLVNRDAENGVGGWTND